MVIVILRSLLKGQARHHRAFDLTRCPFTYPRVRQTCRGLEKFHGIPSPASCHLS